MRNRYEYVQQIRVRLAQGRLSVVPGIYKTKPGHRPPNMSDGVAESCVVLELEADLEDLEAAIQAFTPGEQPALWEGAARRLWSKIFQMSGNRREVPAPPVELASELNGMASSRAAAIHIITRSRGIVSGQPTPDDEAERLNRNVEEFLSTPRGRERKEDIDRRRQR